MSNPFSTAGSLDPEAGFTPSPATTPSSVGRELMQGVCQIFRREWGVGLVAEHINIAGIGRNEKARQLAIAMILHRKMIEQQFLSADDAVAESGMTPWQCRGALEWLKDTAQAAYPVPATLRPAADQKRTSPVSEIVSKLNSASPSPIW